MRASVLSIVGGGLLLTATSYAAAVERGPAPKVVSFPIEAVSDPVSVNEKRDKTVSLDIDNKKLYYMTKVKIGSPSQEITVQVDTGSSDLWANVPDSKYCQKDTGPCNYGTFNADKSSSFTFLNNDFNISYVDGSGARGAYGKDKIQFGSINLDDFQFGLGNQSTSNRNLFGIGYKQAEAVKGKSKSKPYDNFPAALVKAKYINSQTYSLWLDDFDARKGQVLFGGINKAKFEGQLQKMPVVPTNNTKYLSLQVPLTEVKVKSSALDSPTKDKPLNVLLDSGSSFSVLPSSLTDPIYKKLGAKYYKSQQLAIVDCKKRSKKDHIAFTFNGNVTMNVTLDQMIIPAKDISTSKQASALGRRATDLTIDPKKTCVVGIIPDSSTSGGSSGGILGDTFLRSVYAVYDLDNNEISLAKANTSPGKDHIEEIPAGKDGVPSATGAPPAASTGAASSLTPGFSSSLLINMLGVVAFVI